MDYVLASILLMFLIIVVIVYIRFELKKQRITFRQLLEEYNPNKRK